MPRYKEPPTAHCTIFFCKKCRRAWQEYMYSHYKRTEYYPEHIKGDEYKTCKECEEKKDE